jgi:hypothetical protein
LPNQLVSTVSKRPHPPTSPSSKIILILLIVDHTVEEVTQAYFTDLILDRANLGDLEEDSPYPEVRSAVANIDDPDMPCNTIRVWILGMIMAIVIPGLNQFLCVIIIIILP